MGSCGRHSCCSFPQGRLAVQALLWSIFAFLFCASATSGCMFMKIDGYLANNDPDFVVHENADTSSIGPFGYEPLGTTNKNGFYCVTYSDDQLENLLDDWWKAARVSGILAMICNGLALLLLLASACISYSQLAVMAVAALSFAGSLFEWLLFLFFGSIVTEEPYNGRFYIGGGVVIVGAICAIITGAMTLQILPPENRFRYTVSPPRTNQSSSPTGGAAVKVGRNFPAPIRKEKQETAPNVIPQAYEPGTETITETMLPDGSKKVVKTIMHLDGSKSVTETIVRTA